MMAHIMVNTNQESPLKAYLLREWSLYKVKTLYKEKYLSLDVGEKLLVCYILNIHLGKILAFLIKCLSNLQSLDKL